MKISVILFGILTLLISCSDDSGDEPVNQTGSFQYTVSGAASMTVTGDDAIFGSGNGEVFVRLSVDTEDLTIRIINDIARTGSFEVNPVLVEVGQPPIPIEEGDAFAVLGIGSSLSNNRRNFSTDAANGGAVQITSVEDNVIKGSFNMSLIELQSGMIGSEPEINVQGQFTAISN